MSHSAWLVQNHLRAARVSLSSKFFLDKLSCCIWPPWRARWRFKIRHWSLAIVSKESGIGCQLWQVYPFPQVLQRSVWGLLVCSLNLLSKGHQKCHLIPLGQCCAMGHQGLIRMKSVGDQLDSLEASVWLGSGTLGIAAPGNMLTVDKPPWHGSVKQLLASSCCKRGWILQWWQQRCLSGKNFTPLMKKMRLSANFKSIIFSPRMRILTENLPRFRKGTNCSRQRASCQKSWSRNLMT